jgi:hypothetical protein
LISIVLFSSWILILSPISMRLRSLVWATLWITHVELIFHLCLSMHLFAQNSSNIFCLMDIEVDNNYEQSCCRLWVVRHFNSLILHKWVEKVVPIAQIELGLKYSIFSQILVPGLLSHGPQHNSHAGVLDHFPWSILDAVQLSNSLNMGVILRQKNINIFASRPSNVYDFIKF